ncbi:MAG: Xaa-Pro peptidase family protein [Anaerolineae bacterium]|nr:Xaa-Pro peptidase family protein [Anaerolineae bacterium]
MSQRITLLKNIMQKTGLDAVVLNPSPNLTYLTGLTYHLNERPTLLIIPQQGDPVAVLPEFETGKLKTASINIKPFAYNDNPLTWPDVFKQAASFVGLDHKKVGVDPLHLRFLEFNLLQPAAPDAIFVPAEKEIGSLRLHKDEYELMDMRKAIDIAQEAFQATLAFIKPGVTEKEIAEEITIQMLRRGSNIESEFAAIIASGPNSANPHHTPTDRKIETGDAIVIDWGARYNGYYSDLTRTVHMGEAAGRAAGKPGLPAGEVDNATRAVIEAGGYGSYFTHRTGHGLGLEVHEPVYIYAENRQPLEVGVTHTVEPGIYLPGKFGVRIEDNVLVTEQGCETLSFYSRELIIL